MARLSADGRPPVAGRRLRVAGWSGLAVSLLALACCATPLLATLLGLAGLAAATGSVGPVIDAVAIPLAIVSVVLIGLGLRSAARGATSRGPDPGGSDAPA